MPRAFVDRSGQRFGRLIVLRPISVNPTWFECNCDCGNLTQVRSGSLRNGATQSCGCFNVEIHTKHGGSSKKTPEYMTWKSIKQRCLNPKDKSFKDYGARGIGMSTQWLDDFPAFLAHVGKRPSKKHSIERINNNRGYVPGNVRWATRVEQNSNTRRNTFVEINGERLTMSEAARRSGVPLSRLYHRIAYGWPLERALRPEKMNRWSPR